MESNMEKKMQDFSHNMITYLNQFKKHYAGEHLFDRLLAETYYEIAEKDLARYYCERVLMSDPEDQKMISLKNKL